MTTKTKRTNKILSVLLCVVLILTYIPISVIGVKADTAVNPLSIVADPGTADTWENMMGTDSDGNRYAGRVWADKSVYTNGQTVTLNNSGSNESKFTAVLEDDEAFQVVFSVLGSSMTTTTTTSSTGPMDVVIILDNSSSMGRYTNAAAKYSRLEAVTDASNELISQILSNGQNRLAVVTYSTDASVILPLNSYEPNDKVLTLSSWSKGNADSSGGVRVEDGDGKMTASATILGTNTKSGSTNTGFQRGTNLQSGINAGMKILNDTTDTSGRTPVVIVLTDGVADTAAVSNWNSISSSNYRQPSDNTLTAGVALSTLLNASYWRASLEDKYGKAATVYGVGVDLDSNSDAEIVMNPTVAFNSNGTSVASTAYKWFNDWQNSNSSITKTDDYRTSWTFNQLPLTSNVSKADVIGNINYVDTYYDVSSSELEGTFEQIYEELSSGAFNPITDTSTADGATGVEDTPLIYVDTIGKYMEIKEIDAVTLFGASYPVIRNEDGTYTVQKGTGTNPTTNENYNTAEDIKISLIEENGVQKLEIRIAQEVLPIILEQVQSKTVAGVNSATITEMTYNPLRVYYTVGIDSDILLPNGAIDATKIDKDYPYINGNEITLYSNAFGIMNAADENGDVQFGDAHVGFKPSNQNRYYYHQSNQGIFTKITNASNGSVVTIPENQEYGIRYEKGKYNFTYLTYDDYKTLKDSDTVYTYVTYYHPTPSETDAANAAEEVTYIVYTNWGYLKESVGFYDFTAGKYINYDETKGYTTSDIGYTIDKDKVEATIEAYLKANPNADVTAVLGVGSLRTSRLHNMMVEKSENNTSTAELSYAPEYTYETASIHHDNDVVIWLGNNGKLTTVIDTGIALTKSVTEAIGNENDTYALTVTIPEGTNAVPLVTDAQGNDVTTKISTYINNVLTVNLKAGEMVYVTGIPSGTECLIGENIPDNAEYYILSKTEKVVVSAVEDVLNGQAEQFVNAIVTNTPHKFGNLYITKELSSDHNIPDNILQEEFALEINGGATLAGQTFNVLGIEGITSVTFDNSGKANLTIKARQTIEIIGIPEETPVTVTEILTEDQGEKFKSEYRSRNHTGEDSDTDNSVTIPAGANATVVITNTYTPLKTTVDLDVEVTKNFIVDDGVATSGGTFNFKVQYRDDSQWKDITTGSITYEANESGTKKINIENVLKGIEYTTTGSWAYQVIEVKGGIANLTYDRTLYTFTVTVTDNGGQLVARVTDLNKVLIDDGVYEVEFNNIYNTAPVSLDIVKTVTNLSGDHEISSAGFAFTALQTDENWELVTGGKPYTVYSDAAGEARITDIYKETGTYYYILREARPYGSQEVTSGEYKGMYLYNGWYYDATEYRIRIDITVDDSGNLKGNMTLNGNNLNSDSGSVSFANIYDPKDAVVNVNKAVKKSLVGKNLEADMFTFYLCNNGEADAVLNGSKSPLLIGKNDAEGNVIFNNDGKLTFERFGKYEYDVVEAIPDGAIYDAISEKYILNGMSYDPIIYDMVVEVEDNIKTGKLEATYYFEDSTTETVTFNNSYNVAPTEYQISGHKNLTGRAMQIGEFYFELYEGVTWIETVTNRADGSFEFSAINYTETGVHTYEIREKVGNTPGITYTGADHPVTVTVTVEDINGELVASADKSASEIQFENIYNAAPAHVTFNGTKNVAGELESDSTFTFKLYRTDHTFDINSPNAELVATKQNGVGDFIIETIEYTVADIYFYTVVEDASADAVENVVYDRTKYNYRVQVRDNNVGALIVAVEDMAAGGSDNNAYTPSAVANSTFTNATFDEAAKKQVYMSGNTTTHIDGKKVNEGDILTYFITYTNYTGEDTVVDIMDAVPMYTSYVDGSASHNASYAAGHLNWILTVAKGESVTVSFDVKVDETNAVIANTAIIRDGTNTYSTNEVTNYTEEEKEDDNGEITPPPTTPSETPSTPGSAPTPPTTNSANTGDRANLTLWFALLFVSGGIVGTMCYRTRKRKVEEN